MALLLSNLLTTQNFNHASGRGLGTAFGRPLAAQVLFGMTEISRGLGTAFGRPLAAQALFGMTEIPVLMEKCIACEQLLCTFARRELIGKLMGM